MPASPRFAFAVLLVLAGAASGCGGAAIAKRTVSVRPDSRRPAIHHAEPDVESPGAGKAIAAKRERDRREVNAPEPHGKEQLDRAVAGLALSAEQTGFTDLGVLVELSARQIERASLEGEAEAVEDLARAEDNLKRVLTIDEHSPSASNQLALLHLAKAKRLGRPELELAMGVCLWATRENPTFAPLRNTIGLVEFELRDVAGAIRSFEAAVRLDPSYFEDAERVYDRMIAEQPEYATEIRLAKQRVHDLGGGKAP